jgi:hypothetical protein
MNESRVRKCSQPFQHAHRIGPERDQIAQNQMLIHAALRGNVRQHRTQRD